MNKYRQFATANLLIAFLLLFVSGCTKQSLPLFYYTLESSNQAHVSQTEYKQNILVGPITISSFLDKGQLITQNSAYSVSIEEQHRWAGNLKEMLSDSLINNLSLDLGTNNVYTFPNSHGLKALQLELTLTHFEEDTNGHAFTQARWKIIDSTQAILYTTTSTYIIQPESDSHSSLVKGLSIGTQKLSKDIADAIRTLAPSEE
jgi:uncharacterized lipoprotein YmbA